MLDEQKVTIQCPFSKEGVAVSGDDLTLEKLRIHDRLSSLEVKMAELLTGKESEHRMMQETCDRLATLVTSHERLLRGNGGVGLMVRVHDVEKFQRILVWLGAAILIPILGVFGISLYEVTSRERFQRPAIEGNRGILPSGVQRGSMPNDP